MSKPRVGDVVIVQQGIGVVRYVGQVDFDEGEYIGIEIKGNAVIGGQDGTWNNKKYFTCRPKRGIFVQSIIRIIPSEELLHKVAELYDILKGRQNNSHFIDRDSYDELLKEKNHINNIMIEYKEKLENVQELLNMMKFDFNNKLIETANLHDKIHQAEQKLGKRLSFFTKTQPIDSSSSNNTNTTTHVNSRQARESKTLEELNEIGKDFQTIASDIDPLLNKSRNSITANEINSFVIESDSNELNSEHKEESTSLQKARGSIVLPMNNELMNDTSQIIPNKTQGKGFNIGQDIEIPLQHKTGMHYRKISGSTREILSKSKQPEKLSDLQKQNINHNNIMIEGDNESSDFSPHSPYVPYEQEDVEQEQEPEPEINEQLLQQQQQVQQQVQAQGQGQNNKTRGSFSVQEQGTNVIEENNISSDVNKKQHIKTDSNSSAYRYFNGVD